MERFLQNQYPSPTMARHPITIAIIVTIPSVFFQNDFSSPSGWFGGCVGWEVGLSVTPASVVGSGLIVLSGSKVVVGTGLVGSGEVPSVIFVWTTSLNSD